MSNQSEDGWYPECEVCGMGNCGKMVCLDCYNDFKGQIKRRKEQMIEFSGKTMIKKKIDKQIQKEVQEIMFDWSENYDKTELVQVVWEDARTLSGTADYIGIKENGLLTARTIGYLVYEDEKRIAVCGFLFPDENHSLQDPKQNTAFRDTHMIPKGCIKHVAVLKTDWEETKKFRNNHKDWFVKGQLNEGESKNDLEI